VPSDRYPTGTEPGRPHGAFGIDDTKTIEATGANGDCTIPNQAVGLSLNVTAVGATRPTFLTIWPSGALPTASSLNPFPGEPPTPNAVATNLSGSGAFNIYNLQGSVNVIVDINGYYTKTSLQELNDRIAALETDNTTLKADIAASEANIASLDEAQPFTVASDPIAGVTAQSTITEIRSVTVIAPVAGHVAAVASGEMAEGTDGETVMCGLMDSVTDPPAVVLVVWQSPTGGDRSHLSATRVFDIAAGATATYSLVCRNGFGGTASIFAPQVTAIFTPAP
jgi:hypothetical protein